MLTISPPSDPFLPDELAGRIAAALERDGYLVLPDALPVRLAAALLDQVQSLDARQFSSAGTGREQDHSLDSRVRTDRIHWLDPDTMAARDYLRFVEELRSGLNRRLFLGLFDYECHFACYGPGAFYARHLDAFEGRRNRILSTVFYLNAQRSVDDGGELVLYARDGENVIEVIKPEFNTLVVFLSERFPHEVLTARRERYSLTGWYRVNATTSQVLDPPA